MNTKEKLLGLKLKEKTIEIEGEIIIVKEMTAGEGTEYESTLYKVVNGKVLLETKNARAKLIALTCHDAEGKKIFPPKDIEQVKLLPNTIASQLFSAASEVNNLTPNGSMNVGGAKKN